MQQSYGRLSALLGDLDGRRLYYIVCFNILYYITLHMGSVIIYVAASVIYGHWVMCFVEEEKLFKYPKR